MAYVAGLLADFDRYLAAGTPDLGRDGAGYTVAGLYLTDAELAGFLRDFATVGLRAKCRAHLGIQADARGRALAPISVRTGRSRAGPQVEEEFARCHYAFRQTWPLSAASRHRDGLVTGLEGPRSGPAPSGSDCRAARRPSCSLPTIRAALS